MDLPMCSIRATGKLLRTVTVAPSPAGVRANLPAVDEQMVRVVVLTEPFLASIRLMGYVEVPDARSRSGQLLHTTPLAVGNTGWLAVDAQARRAVVVGIPDYLRRRSSSVKEPHQAP
jgi:hypothetical protein